MLIFPEIGKNEAKYFLIWAFLKLRKYFFFKWVNQIFWVAAISVGQSKRGNKQDFKLSLISSCISGRNQLLQDYM
jgi:hypothetical protein